MMLKKPFTEKAAEKVAENGIVQNKFRVIIVDVVVCLVPSSIMRKFIYKSGRTQSAQGRETCP